MHMEVPFSALKQLEPDKNAVSFIVSFYGTILDVRALVGDDELMDGGILAALEEYNTEELATVEVPGIEGKVQPPGEVWCK